MVSLINHLTTDNDERQELWVHYLENSDITALSDYLSQIRQQYSEEQLLQITVWKQLENPSDFNLQWVFDHFTDLEQSVIQLLILGVSLKDISGIKGIGLMRLRHVVSIICDNPAWEELDGT
jgi:DNA integrity scanning protein DisA with diadenylate cyclase activity